VYANYRRCMKNLQMPRGLFFGNDIWAGAFVPLHDDTLCQSDAACLQLRSVDDGSVINTQIAVYTIHFGSWRLALKRLLAVLNSLT